MANGSNGSSLVQQLAQQQAQLQQQTQQQQQQQLLMQQMADRQLTQQPPQQAPQSSSQQPSGSFKKGGRVKKTGVYRLHKGETVLPAKRVRGGGQRNANSKGRLAKQLGARLAARDKR